MTRRLAWLLLAGCAPDPTPSEEVQSCGDAVELPDGSCISPGLRPEHCGAGFVHDGAQSCVPTLPPEACARGLMAVPGDSSCRAVMPCGSGKWGSLAIDGATVHVDGSYAGTDSDGSEARPWTTIADAYAAASPGALIAVAEGRYVEDVVAVEKAVRLWGVCPEKVELAGTGGGVGKVTLILGTSATGIEVGGIAVTGPGVGIHLSGATGVRLDRVWIHDNPMRGINVEDTWGATALEVLDSLIEDNGDIAVYLGGAEAKVARSMVRGTVPGVYDTGRGINAQLSCDDNGCNVASRSTLTLVGSLIERNHDAGLVVAASDATVESTVVRDTQPRVADGRHGWGLTVGPSCTPATGCDPATRGTAHVTGSVFERNQEIGVAIMGSDATLRGVVVRDTWPRASDQQLGRGINIQLACSETSCDATARANVTMVGVLVENNHDTGIFVGASDVVVEDAMVRATLPQASDGLFGRGVNAQSLFTVDDGCVPFTGSSATIRRSLIEDSYDVSLFVGGSDVALEGVVVRRTRARMFDGFNGDGVAVVGGASTASATITNTRIDESARAGLSNFGATVSLTMSSIACAAFALEGQAWEERDFVFDDHGENQCGCPAEGVCKALTTGLAPPTPIEIESP